MQVCKRRLWEFHGSNICRILGMAFDDKELERIVSRKLNIKEGVAAPPGPAEWHGALVQLCAESNELSKYVDKLLERKFELYQRTVAGVNQEDICRFIEGGEVLEELKSIPIEALMWFASRNHHDDVVEIEKRVFHAVHMKEHRALKFYDALSRELPDGKVEKVMEKLKQAREDREKLERRLNRSEQKKERLRLDIEAIKENRAQLAQTLAEERRANDNLRNTLDRLGGQSTLEQIEALERGKDVLAQEVKNLTEELVEMDMYSLPLKVNKVVTCPINKVETETAFVGSTKDGWEESPSLNGMKVAFVGGLDSLMPHYRQMVEQWGGVFCSHCGRCQAKGELECVIGGADMVFCPIDINSHGACRVVKKVCKYTGKPCCFMRSASLSTFRRELVELARNTN